MFLAQPVQPYVIANGFRVSVKLVWLDVICAEVYRFSVELEPSQCKTRQLGKRQLQYLTCRLRDKDVNVYVANIAKQMEDKDAVQLRTFECKGEIFEVVEELKLLAVF